MILKSSDGSRCLIGALNAVVSIEEEFGLVFPNLADYSVESWKKKCRLVRLALFRVLKGVGQPPRSRALVAASYNFNDLSDANTVIAALRKAAE